MKILYRNHIVAVIELGNLRIVELKEISGLFQTPYVIW